jgi:hypothetical protein
MPPAVAPSWLGRTLKGLSASCRACRAEPTDPKEEPMNQRTGRRPLLSVLALIALALAGTPPAARADDRTVRRDLDAIYAKYVQAAKQKEKTALKQFIQQYTVADFQQKVPGGRTLNRAQVTAMMTEGPAAGTRIVDEQLKIHQLAVKGNVAVMTYNDQTTAIVADQQGKSHKIVSTSTSRDTWVKKPAGWKMRLSEVLQAKTMMDGKPVPQP